MFESLKPSFRISRRLCDFSMLNVGLTQKLSDIRSIEERAFVLKMLLRQFPSRAARDVSNAFFCAI